MTNFDNEQVLEDDYPVYAGYWYVLDGQPRQSTLTGTIADLKRRTGAQEVRRCNLVGRNLPMADMALTEMPDDWDDDWSDIDNEWEP